MDPRLRSRFCLQISGPSGSGKTVWVKILLENVDYMIDKKVEQIIYCYGEYQPIFQEIQKNFRRFSSYRGVSWLKKLNGSVFHTLMVIDDLQNKLSNNFELAKLFTKESHHRCISVMFLQQALYNKGTFSWLCSLNCHYMILFKIPRDQTIIHTLARQMFPGSGQYLVEVYQNATEKTLQLPICWFASTNRW